MKDSFDHKTKLTEKERHVIHVTADKVLKSILHREKNSTKRSLLRYRAMYEFEFAIIWASICYDQPKTTKTTKTTKK